ncbi:MAG: hypothetical protein K6F33_02505 [Bacteroidales bacterium]|nr:hypothetical protein [Bacteroidales bacterium]
MEQQENSQTTEKQSLGCMVTLIAIILVGAGCMIALGMFLLKTAEEAQPKDLVLQDRIFQLPELSSDAEITAAINSGDPKDYLIKDYVFQKAKLIRDTSKFDFLSGQYICIDIVKEININQLSKKAKDTIDITQLEEPYCQIIGELYMNDGTLLRKPDSLLFLFPFLKKTLRIWDSEINPHRLEYYIEGRFYPNRDDHSICYNITYMAQDEKATFAARLGNGKASLDVFPGTNIVIVGGERINTSNINSIGVIAWNIIGYVLIVSAIIGGIILIIKVITQKI